MRDLHSKVVIVFLMLLLCFSLDPGQSLAQGEASNFASKGISAKSKAAQAFDEQAKEKLKQMSPKEVTALDKMLAQALTLFYEHKYVKALPLFEKVASQVETMDIKFWLASCARGAGKLDLAVKKYQEMLAIDPSLHRVRLELAATQMQKGEYKNAKKNFEIVLSTNPPVAVKNNIQKMLATIEAKTKKLFPHFRLGIGMQGDTNVSAGPDRSTIGTPGGGIIRLGRTQKELSDWVVMASGTGSILYDLGKRNGLMWHGDGNFYLTRNTTYDEFDYSLWRVATGPWWVGKRSILKIPFAYSSANYDDYSLYDSWDFAPSYEYFFFKWLGIKATFAYVHEDYEPRNRQDEDNINRIWEIQANFYLNDGKDTISIFYFDENLNARDFGYSYDAYNVGASYFKLLPWEMDLYVRYKYTSRDYEGQPKPVRYFGFTGSRDNKRHNLYLGLSKYFAQHLYATLYFNYINNDSTSVFYEFDKMVYGLQVGIKY